MHDANIAPPASIESKPFIRFIEVSDTEFCQLPGWIVEKQSGLIIGPGGIAKGRALRNCARL